MFSKSAFAARLVANPMLAQALCLPLEQAVNQLLAHDGQALARLQSRAGHLICIEVDQQRWFMRLLDHGIGLSLSNEAQADVTLSGSLSDFINLAKADDKANTLINSGIEMNGDTELALLLTRVLQQLDIDFEALISPLTGGLVAHQLGKGVRGLFKWGQQTRQTYQVAARDYLQDEAQLLASKTEMETFSRSVDKLRQDGERLEAKVARLVRNIQADKNMNKDGDDQPS